MAPFGIQTVYMNEVVFEEGWRGASAYILKKGSIEISIRVRGKKVVIKTLEPVAVFGEMALILREHKRTATALARMDSEVVVISREVFEDYIQRTPQIIRTVLETFASRLRETTQKVSRTPDLFLAICNILNLMLIHDRTELVYDQTVEILSRTLLVDTSEIKDKLEILENSALVAIRTTEKTKKLILLVPSEGFYQKAVRLHQIISTVIR